MTGWKRKKKQCQPTPGKSEKTAMNETMIQLFLKKVEDELNEDILPFWLTHLRDRKHGGFVGRLSNDLVADEQAPKGLILHTRLLWAFSALARFLKDRRCEKMAYDAYQIVRGDFWDGRYGGAYWQVGAEGPIDVQKKTYGQAFLIYGLAEYYRLARNAEPLAMAQEVFERLERHAHDEQNGGYLEVMERDWRLSPHQQLSAEDLVAPKSMNTHLHLLEAYTELYLVWPDAQVLRRLEELLEIFLKFILEPRTHHFRLFFERDWKSLTGRVSFGHDIEGSWLLHRAQQAADKEDEEWAGRVVPASVQIAKSVLEEGLDEDGGLLYERLEDGRIRAEKHFWCQAEAVVGFVNAYQLTGEPVYLEAAWKVWQFIETYQVDRTYGEWFWKLDERRTPDLSLPKVSEWKCPYHNSRACIETIQRLRQILREPVLSGQGER
jgi:mannobiose 2-epimerase